MEFDDLNEARKTGIFSGFHTVHLAPGDVGGGKLQETMVRKYSRDAPSLGSARL